MNAKVANRRIRLLLAVFGIAFGIAFLRAAWLQGVRASSLGQLASSQHNEDVTIPATRGTIYDRGGLQLAIGEQATTVYADPRQVRDPRSEAAIAARLLRLDPTALYSALADRTRGFVYVERKADPARAALLERRHLPGLGFYPEERRFYPQGSLAAQVLGYAGVDNHGLAGLELSLDHDLAGRPGRERIVKDASGEVIDTVPSQTERDGTKHDGFSHRQSGPHYAACDDGSRFDRTCSGRSGRPSGFSSSGRRLRLSNLNWRGVLTHGQSAPSEQRRKHRA